MPSDTERRTMRGYDVEIVRTSCPPGVLTAKAHIRRGTLVIGIVMTPTHAGDNDWLVWARLDSYAAGFAGFTGSLELAIATLLDDVEPVYPAATDGQVAR